MQKLLMRRKQELEAQLVRARGTDFADARTDVVSIGTKIHLTEIGSKQKETYAILGAWDSNPDEGIISYLSPLAQAMLNRKPEDEVEFESHGVKKRYRIDQLETVTFAQAQPQAPAGKE
jgi:transcription elongation GreA/GreB family factor